MTFTKSTLFAAASAIALLAAAPVYAADTTAKEPTTQMNAGTEIKADDLIGKDVNNVSGEKVGDIESVIIDESGKVAAVIVGVGGFLGLGEREVAIDWNDLRVRRNGDEILTDLTKEDLENLPAYEFEKEDYRQRAFLDRSYIDQRNQMAEAQPAKAEWTEADTSQVRVSKLIGADVVNAQGDTIGEVEDLIVADGRTQLVLSIGEFLEMGGHDVSIDLDKAKILRQQGDFDDLRVSVNMTKEQLKALPEFKPEQAMSRERKSN